VLYQAFGQSGVTTWVSTPSFAQLCLAEKTFSEPMLPLAFFRRRTFTVANVDFAISDSLIAGNRVNDSTSGLRDFRFFGASGNSPSNSRSNRPGASGDAMSNSAR
jgi:hypothetical protein